MQKKDVNKQIEFYCEQDKNIICPFSHKKCKKIARSSLGVCSVFHQGSQQIICPDLFYKTQFLQFVANNILNTNNFIVFKEVKIGNNFLDFLIVDKTNENNYVAVELQSLDTTGNYKWVFGEKVKPFCINWKTTKKTILSQLINKVSLFNKCGKKVVLIIQDSFFKYLKFNENKCIDSDDFYILTYHYENNTFDKQCLYSFSLKELIGSLIESEEIDLDNLVFQLTKNHT